MKLHGDLVINGKTYKKGADIPWVMVYPFFLLHMLMFGGSGFFMAYAEEGPGLGFLYAHGGIAIVVYTVFYLAIFGVDRVKWMFINAGLGLLGIYAQISWILSVFGKNPADYPFAVHVVPFLYYILYTFLLHQMVLDVTGAREDEARQKWVDRGYVGISIAFYTMVWLLGPSW